MAYKTVTTIVTDLDRDRPALEYAAGLAAQAEGHLDVISLGVDPTQPGFYYAGASAIAVQAGLEQAETESRELEAAVKDALEGRPLNWSTTALATQSAGMALFIAHHIRFSDLVVLPKPYGEGRGHEDEAILESALFNAEVPVIVVPDDATHTQKTGTVVLAWNESREAMRAVRQSLPVLQAAESVNVTIIDPPTHAPDRSDPGGALSQMLARHNVNAEVSILAKTLPRVSDVIARQAEDLDADLVVMGAYGHSRFRESILGGATRNILQTTKLPVLMAH